MPATQDTGQHLFFLRAFDEDLVSFQDRWIRNYYFISPSWSGFGDGSRSDIYEDLQHRVWGLAKFLARLHTAR
jgi:hypothetical protein